MDEKPSDAELLRRYAEEKSEAAFGALVRRHLDLVYSAALRQVGGDTHRARDVSQIVFTTLARKAGALKTHPVLVGWLYTTTQHAAAKAVRTEARRHAREQEAHAMNEILAPNPANETAVDWEHVRPVLDAAMRELNDRDREAVLLRFFAQRPFAEIGAALALSEDAARMRVERALDKLHALLARRGVTSTAAALASVLAHQAVAMSPAHLSATVTTAALTYASASASTGTAAILFNFMSTTKIALGVAAVIAAIGIGAALRENQKAQTALTELAALRRDRASVAAKAVNLETRLHSAERNAAAADARRAAAEQETARLRNAAATPAAPAEAPAENPLRELYRNPDYARLELEKFRAGLALRYGPLYRSLALSPEQIARFEAALTEGQQGVSDIWSAASSQGLALGTDSPTSTSIARMTSAPLTAMEQALKNVLGGEGYQKYQQYDQVRSTRELVASLAGSIYHSDTPLTASQGEALAGILDGATKKIKTPMADDGGKILHVLNDVTDWEAVKTQAQTLLSPAQFKALRALLDQSRLEQELTRIVEAPTAPAGKP